MSDYTFTFRFLSPGQGVEDLSIRLYELLDNVSLLGPDEDGSFLLEFDRRGDNIARALAAALEELLKALPDAIVLRVEEDDLMTMADIARRAGRTPESVRLLVSGRRGPGGFPPAAGRLDARTKVWRVTDVALWFEEAFGKALPDTSDSAFVQAFNDALEIRRLATRLGGPQRQAIAKALPGKLASTQAK